MTRCTVGAEHNARRLCQPGLCGSPHAEKPWVLYARRRSPCMWRRVYSGLGLRLETRQLGNRATMGAPGEHHPMS